MKKRKREKDGDDKKGICTIKVLFQSIIKKEYRDFLKHVISERSIKATKISALASLHFLFQIERAFENNHRDFFAQDQEYLISRSFYAVLKKNIFKKNNIPEFRSFVADLDPQYQFEWPDNDKFGNAFKYLYGTYETNVKNNLNTHAAKRIRQYLKMKVYQNNLNPIIVRYEDYDIDNAIRWCIYGNDIYYQTNDIVTKRARRDLLLQTVYRLSWFDIEDGNIGRFTKIHWLKSIQLWIAMQREIDEFNVNEERRQPLQQQPNEMAQKRPQVRNLAIIPICKFDRKHYTIDNDVFYRLLSEYNLLPKDDDGNKIEFKPFMTDKSWYWSQVFDMRKINRLGKRKKSFHYQILSDGVSVSILYDVKKEEFKPIDMDVIRNKYNKGEFVYELGVDPGMKTWNATTRRTIDTGKEVSRIYIQKTLQMK